VVRDHNGQQLAYVYFEDEPGRRSAAKLLSKDERAHRSQLAGGGVLSLSLLKIISGRSDDAIRTELAP
jgi:hypothetical protein